MLQKLSIVLPFYNEEANLPRLAAELAEILPALSDRFSVECLFVDDGSTDSSLERAQEIRTSHPELHARVIALPANAGLSAAMNTGFRAATGTVVATLDTDLQNDPRDLPKLLAHLDAADVVVGVRVHRRDGWIKRVSSRIANGIRNRATHEDIVDTGCSLKVYRKAYLDRIKLYTGLHRFLPTLLKMEGARVLQVEVNHRPRVHGKAKYHLRNRLIGPLLDLFAVRWMQHRTLPTEWRELP